MKIRRLLVLTAVASWAGNCPMYVECPGLSEVLFTYLRNHVQQSYIEYVQEHTLTKDVENFVEALLSFMPKNPEEIIETAISEIIDEGPNMVTMYDLSELEPLPSPQRPATGTHNANPPPPARSPSWQSFRKVHGTFGLQRGYSSFGGPKCVGVHVCVGIGSMRQELTQHCALRCRHDGTLHEACCGGCEGGGTQSGCAILAI